MFFNINYVFKSKVVEDYVRDQIADQYNLWDPDCDGAKTYFHQSPSYPDGDRILTVHMFNMTNVEAVKGGRKDEQS
jgi:hypothetical protein